MDDADNMRIAWSWVCIAIGAGCAISGMYRLPRAIGQNRWKRIEATVVRYTEPEAKWRGSPYSESDPDQWSEFDVTYRYEVAGAVFTRSYTEMVNEPDGNTRNGHLYQDQRPPGATVEVFYDPDRPDNAAREVTFKPDEMFALVATGVTLVAGGCLWLVYDARWWVHVLIFAGIFLAISIPTAIVSEILEGKPVHDEATANQ